jgi:hypothetical protein
MNSNQVLFLFPDDTDDALSRVRPRIEALGLHADTLFDLGSACSPRQDRPCPHDGHIPCSCRLTVLRVGSTNWTCFLLVLHSHGGRTWMTIEDYWWASTLRPEPAVMIRRKLDRPPDAESAPEGTAQAMLQGLRLARQALTSAAEELASDDPCLRVIASLTEARGHLRAAARCAVRRHWQRGRQAVVAATDVGERAQAASRLLDILHYVVLRPSLVAVTLSAAKGLLVAWRAREFSGGQAGPSLAALAQDDRFE